MPAKPRQQKVILFALLGLLALVVVWQLWPSAPNATASASRPTQPRATGRPPVPGESAPDSDVVEVQVADLREAPPAIESGGRNPFRFQQRQADAPPQASPPSPPAATPADTGPPPVPPPAPITLKFIGVVTGQSTTGKVAVLSDGKFVYYGREGDIIEGRYRLVRIGEESVQMEHVDGRGRQTIRLSGA